MAHTLARDKESIWIETNETITEIWPSIQIIFQQEELIHKSKEVVKEIKTYLGQKPGEATPIIKILNSKTKEELEELGN